MRAAVVVGRDDPVRDGVADYVRRLVAHLPSYGVEPVVVEAGGRVREAARELRRLDPDVVHVQVAPSAYGFSPAVGLLPALVRAPLVTTLHEYGWWQWPARVPDLVWKPVERRGIWDRETGRLTVGAEAVLCTTPGHARVLQERTGRTATVVPIGPNVERVAADRAQVRAQWGLPPDAPVVVFFGFVHPVKGVRWLLRAVQALRERTRPDLRLVVAGGFDSLALPGREATDFEAEVRADVTALGLDEAVTVTGWLPSQDVSGLLQAADVAALPFTAGLTTKSGSMLAVLDHDLPLVGTSGPDTEPGLVAAALLGPVREFEVLAAHLERALAGDVPGGGRALADAHSWQAAAKAHAEVYERVRRA